MASDLEKWNHFVVNHSCGFGNCEIVCLFFSQANYIPVIESINHNIDIKCSIIYIRCYVFHSLPLHHTSSYHIKITVNEGRMYELYISIYTHRTVINVYHHIKVTHLFSSHIYTYITVIKILPSQPSPSFATQHFSPMAPPRKPPVISTGSNISAGQRTCGHHGTSEMGKDGHKHEFPVK